MFLSKHGEKMQEFIEHLQLSTQDLVLIFSLGGGAIILFFLLWIFTWHSKGKLKVELADALQEKTLSEQRAIKSTTEAEGLQVRLQERDDYLRKHQQKLQEQHSQLQRLNGQMALLNGQFSTEKSKADSFSQQLTEKQQTIEKHELHVDELLRENSRLQNELTELKTTLEEKAAHFAELQKNVEESKGQLTIEFQNLANRILEEKSQTFSQQNQVAMTDLLKPFREQIDSFQKRVNEIHSESLKGNAGIEAEIKKMFELGLSMSQEANNLTSALKGNKKALGNWGEIQLEQTLQMAGLEPGVHYVAQEYFTNDEGKKQYPDFVLHLPDNKHMVIDSKMSLVDYERAVSAESDGLRQGFLNEHCKALRNHIDDLSKKNYSALKGMDSPNFVLMFIALEPAYIEALRNDPTIFDYGYQKNVIMVSHTTLMPILRTIANLWRLEKGNQEAAEISRQAGDLYNQLCTVVDRLKRLGNTLNTASNQYNDTVVAFAGKQGIIGKAERFQKLSNRANKSMPELEMVQSDGDRAHLLDMLEVQNDELVVEENVVQ